MLLLCSLAVTLRPGQSYEWEVDQIVWMGGGSYGWEVDQIVRMGGGSNRVKVRFR
jgi:inosine-uridine nucleoside N-ribohydrolase